MQIIVSILLDLKLVNMQNPRSVAFMQEGITSEFFFFFKKIMRSFEPINKKNEFFD